MCKLEKFKAFLYSEKVELICLILYKILLDYSFFMIIAVNYNEQNQFSVDFNIIKYIIGWIIIFLFYYMNKKLLSSLPKFIIKLFINLIIIPITTVFALKNESYFAFFMIVFSVIISISIVRLLMKRKKNKSIIINERVNKLFSNLIYYCFLLNTVILVVAIFYYNGFPTLNAFDLKNVYEVREAFYLPKYFYYLYEFESGFIIYFLLITCIQRKKYFSLACLIITQLLFFLWKGDKAALFGLILVIIVYLIDKRISLIYFLNKAFLFISFTSVIIYYTISSMPFVLFVRRVLIVPANLKFIYIDFFSSHEKIGIVGTIINSILKIPNPYNEMPYQNLISEIYFNKKDMWSNTGYLIEGYARNGILGQILVALLFGLVLYILYISSKRLGSNYMLAISILPIFTLNDGYLFSSFLFGAVGLLCLVGLFFNDKYIVSNKSMILRIKEREKEK